MFRCPRTTFLVNLLQCCCLLNLQNSQKYTTQIWPRPQSGWKIYHYSDFQWSFETNNIRAIGNVVLNSLIVGIHRIGNHLHTRLHPSRTIKLLKYEKQKSEMLTLSRLNQNWINHICAIILDNLNHHNTLLLSALRSSTTRMNQWIGDELKKKKKKNDIKNQVKKISSLVTWGGLIQIDWMNAQVCNAAMRSVH